MSVEKIAPSDRNNHESIAVILQTGATLRFACYGGLLFLTIQIALSRVAPGFDGHRWCSFFLLALVGLTAGCAGWAWGMVLSPIASQAGGAQKVLAGFAVFWTGVIVGHLPQIASAFSGWQKTSINQAARIEMLFGLGVFLFAVCITFNTRFVRSRGVP